MKPVSLATVFLALGLMMAVVLAEKENGEVQGKFSIYLFNTHKSFLYTTL
jgi:hypothetical protein